jgi:hypothetical protein
MLQAQIAAFKKAVRLINKHSTQEEHEWLLETTYSKKHILRSAAIEHRQAAIRGTPRPSEEDARKVMKMILAMRGLDKKKHLDAWERGALTVLPQKMKMQGAAQAWRRAIVKGEVWNDEKEENHSETLVLNDVLCPACNNPQKTLGMKLKVKDGYSSIKCKSVACQKITISSAWKCRCRKKWVKCPMHVHDALNKSKPVRIKRKQTEGERQRLLKGVDVQKPVKRRSCTAESRHAIVSEVLNGPSERALFKSTSIFAKRFPHLLQDA